MIETCKNAIFQTLSHYEVANARRRAPRKGVPSTRQKCEVAGALCFFCTNATSGIMRGRHLTCARRKERSDGIAIVTKSIASCVPARRALP